MGTGPLRKTGKGIDLIPFQPDVIDEVTWELDCTTLEGFLRPLTPFEIRPYLKRGLKELVDSLEDQGKVANSLKLRTKTTEHNIYYGGLLE